MQFFAITALFAGIAAAAGTQNVNISDLSVRKTSGETTTIQSVSFKIDGNQACEASNPAFPSELISCGGESGYSFALVAGADQSEFALRISRDTGSAAPSIGEGNVPTYCHAGGSAPLDYACAQVSPATITIH